MKVLYIAFANANGLVSSPFSAKINVDLFPLSAMSINATNSPIVFPNSPNINLGIQVHENAKHMMISQSNIFSGASWLPVEAAAIYSFPRSNSSCGNKNIYFKFKDKDGFESSVITVPVNIVCTIDIVQTGMDFNRLHYENRTVTALGRKIYVWGIRPSSPTCTSMTNGQQTDAGCASGGAFYDLDSNSGWTTISDSIRSTRGRAAVVSLGNKLYTFGGWDGWTGAFPGATQIAPGLQIYNPANDTWSSGNSSGMPTCSLVGHYAVATDSSFIVWSGNSNNAAEYNPTTDSWSSLPSGGPFPSRGGGDVLWTDTGIWTGTEVVFISRAGQCGGGGCAASGSGSGCDGSANGAISILNKAAGTWRQLNSKAPYPNPVYYNGFIYFPDSGKKLDIASDQLSYWVPPVESVGQYGFTVVDGKLFAPQIGKLIPFEAFPN